MRGAVQASREAMELRLPASSRWVVLSGLGGFDAARGSCAGFDGLSCGLRVRECGE